MKYYFVTITEVDGEYEFTSSFLTKTDTDEDQHFDKLWKTFRIGEVDPDDIWSDSILVIEPEVDDQGDLWVDSILVKEPEWQEIPIGDFNVMKQYLTVV